MMKLILFFYYVINGPLYIITTYNEPNNHIFHSLCTWFSTILAGESILSIRLTAFVFGLLIISITYKLVLKLYNNKYIALCSAFLVSISSYMIEYSVNGRGYTLGTFLMLFGFYYAFDIFEKYNLNKFVLSIIAFALSIYTIPTLVYGVLGIWLWLLYCAYISKNKQLLFLYAKLIFLSILLSAILYFPVFFEIIKNSYAQPIAFSDFIFGFINLFKELIFLFNRSMPYLLHILVYISFLVYFYKSIISKKKENLLPIFVFFTSFLCILAQRVIPPPRVFVYLIPFYFIAVSIGLYCIAVYLKKKFHNFHNKILLFLSIFLCLSGFGVYNDISEKAVYMSEETGRHPYMEEIADWLIKNGLQENDFVLANIGQTSLEYYLQIKNKLKFSRQNVSGIMYYPIFSNKSERENTLLEMMSKEKFPGKTTREAVYETENYTIYRVVVELPKSALQKKS